MKYYYKPIKEEVEKTYIENAGVSPFAEKDYDLKATLIVEADSEEESVNIRKTITHMPHWNLVKTED